MTSLLYVPAITTDTDPETTSDAVIASSFAFAMKADAVARSGRVKHDGSTVNFMIEMGNRVVACFWGPNVIGANSITHPRFGSDTAARPC
jgi:hypothetical protein